VTAFCQSLGEKYVRYRTYDIHVYLPTSPPQEEGALGLGGDLRSPLYKIFFYDFGSPLLHAVRKNHRETNEILILKWTLN
jgi:hypothetical protein